jgi:hypothetical protein
MSQRISIALLAILALAAAPLSRASIIVTTPANVAGMFTMTDFSPDPRADDSAVTSVASPLGGNLQFRSEYGTPLAMTLDKNSGWFPTAFGEVYKTSVEWVELILPANTVAFSFYVGASSNGTGWVEGFDNDGHSAYQAFSLSATNTPGFGFAATGRCGSISKIVVEPWEWGIGNFAISQGSCATVPEPGTIPLLVTGLLGLVALRRRRPV